jgi:transposase
MKKLSRYPRCGSSKYWKIRRGTSKQPVFGILCRGGKVWAKIVRDVEAKTLMLLIKKRVKKGPLICSDTFKSYTGIAAKGKYSDREKSEKID